MFAIETPIKTTLAFNVNGSNDTAAVVGLINQTNVFLAENFLENYELQVVSMSGLAVVSVLEHITNLFAGDSNITQYSADTKSTMIEYLIDELYPLLYSNDSDFNSTQYETMVGLLSVILRDVRQISTESGISVLLELGLIMDLLTGYSSLNFRALSDSIVEAMLDGIFSIGIGFAHNRKEYIQTKSQNGNFNHDNDNDNTNYINGNLRQLQSNNIDSNNGHVLDNRMIIQTTNLALKLVMTRKLIGSLPGETGFLYSKANSYNNYQIQSIETMRQSVTNLRNDANYICGSNYLEHNGVANIMSQLEIEEFNCLFSVHPPSIYDNVPGEPSQSNILSLEFSIFDDDSIYSAQGLIKNAIYGSSNKSLSNETGTKS